MSSTENIRPLNDEEKAKGGPAWKVEGNGIRLAESTGTEPTPYVLDSVFDGSFSTSKVYEATTRGLIRQVIEGFNSTVFAYGQTSSGKTHTMRGTDDDPGIVPRAVTEIFQLIESFKNREFLLRISYMEIYNEDINDLLAPGNTKLQVHEHPQAGVYVTGLREDIVSSPEQVITLLEEGERHRHVGETKMNKSSSRSHTIFRMVIESRSTTAEDADLGAVRVSALTLVDLAGSERIAKTRAEGQRAKEGAAINKSLLTLGTVINKLSEGTNGGHIPYRDSKLTRILQPSLGGNAKTAIICAITPAMQHIEESHSTLRFACRAKRVVNNATVNEVLSDAAVLKRQAREIEDLRQALQTAGRGGDHIDHEISRLRAELLRKDQENDYMSCALAAEKEERERAQRKVESITRMMLEGSMSKEEAPYEPSNIRTKRESRRETWCPGRSSYKRPCLSELTSNDSGNNLDSSGKENSVGTMLRRSDGGALLKGRNGFSPPHKIQKGSHEDADRNCGQDSVDVKSCDDMDTLKVQIRELEAANRLMQQELDAVAASAQRAQSQLKDTEEELVSIAEERDQLLPRLKEAEWKARQAEKSLSQVTMERDDAIASFEELQRDVENLKSNHHDSQERDEAMEQLRGELGRLRSELKDAQTAKVELAETQVEREHLAEKVANAKAALAQMEEKLSSTTAEISAERQKRSKAEERAHGLEARNRSLYEETERLSAHISDLESRKRAPLYQKRQEEELHAALERAKEAEVQAAEAELQAKNVRAQMEACQKELTSAQEELQKRKQEHTELVADLNSKYEASLQRLATEADLVSVRHKEELEAAGAREESLRHQKEEVETALNQRLVEEQRLEKKVHDLQESEAYLKSQLDETQACAEAAAEHIKFLEEKAEHDEESANSENQSLRKEVEEMKQEMEKASKDHEAALISAKEEREALMNVNIALEAAKAELEAKVASVAGALQAAEELKELRRKHKEEVGRLNQALKMAEKGSKGTVKAADRAVRETERLRQQVKDLEKKVQSAAADKSRVQLEKAASERELRTTKDKLEKLAKSMDRIESTEERKRDAIMVELSQCHARISELETALENSMMGLRNSHEELEAQEQKLQCLDGEFKDLQEDCRVKQEECDHLERQLQQAEQRTQEVEMLLTKCQDDIATRDAKIEAANVQILDLERQVDELKDSKTKISCEKVELERKIEETTSELASLQEHVKQAETQLFEIPNLRNLLESAETKLEEMKNTSKEYEKKVRERDSKIDALKENLEDASCALAAERRERDTQASVKDGKIAELEKEIQEKETYISSLETQINDAMAEGMEAQAAIQSANQWCRELESQLDKARRDAEDSQLKSTDMARQLVESREELSRALERASELNHITNDNASTMEGMRLEIQRLSSALEDGDAKVAQLQKDIVELQEELVKISHQKSLIEKENQVEMRKVMESLEEWRTRAETLQTECLETDTRAAGHLKESEAKISSLMDRINELECLLKTKESYWTENAQELKEQLLALKQQEASANEETANLLKRLSESEQHVAYLTKSSKELERELTYVKETLSNSDVSHGQSIARWEAEVQKLKVALESEKSKRELRIQEIEAVKNEEVNDLIHRCKELESQLRKSKRREEKLQALQFRLREDLAKSGGDLTNFDRLMDSRSFEYDLDRAMNRATREKAKLMETLASAERRAEKAEAMLTSLEKSKPAKPTGTLNATPLSDKENVCR